MRSTTTTIVTILLATVGLGGCDWLSDPGAQAHLGVIGEDALPIEAPHREIVEGLERIWLEDVPAQLAEHTYPGQPILEAPDTVQAGEPFTVLVRTHWNDSCLRPAGTEVYEGPGVRVVIPWDMDEQLLDPNIGCAQTPVELTRELGFEFGTIGLGTIEVRGRRFNDEPPEHPRYHAVKEVVVQ